MQLRDESGTPTLPPLVGAQTPRIAVIPEGENHPRWSEITDFLERLGIALDPWQLEVLRASLMRNGRYWAAFTVAVCAPRQNGKNGILEARELIGPCILGEKLIIHSAHLADTSKEGFRRLDDLLDANEWLSKDVKHIWRTNGHESIEFKGGRRIRFRTRTRGGGRGFSGSPVIFDEAMFLPEVSMGAMLPVISAQPDPQVWYTGSAVDQFIHDEGVVFTRVRERALKGDAERLAYFEWSLDAPTPALVSDEELADPESWAATNPALGARISLDYVRAEIEELDPRTFAVERLGVGDWPPTSLKGNTVVDLAKWADLVDANSKIVGPVTFSFDVALDRSSSTIAAAGRRQDGLAHVEIVDRQRGTRWLLERLRELTSRHETNGVFCDAIGHAASLMAALEEEKITVVPVSAKEVAHGCGLFFDAVENGTVRHLGTADLLAALKGAAKRDLGDAWAWSRKSSAIDITPLVAATIALWGINSKPEKAPELLIAAI